MKEELKKLILNRIENGKRTINKLSKSLNITEEETKKLLKELQEDLLVEEKNQIYSLTIDSKHKIGILNTTSKGTGIVKVTDDEVYFIDKENLKNAIHGDKVLIEITDYLRRNAIVKTKKSEIKTMVGTINIKNKKYFVNLDNPSLPIKVKLDKTPEFLKENDKVLVKFIDDKKGEIIEVLGNKDKVGIDITSIIKEMAITDTFQSDALEEISKIKQYVDESDIVGRVDLRSEKTFTIDGEESKDFDDSIGITLLSNNHYLVRVNIADVAHYITENSLLDKIAMQKGASTYLCDRVIPMLPFTLSEGICSLNPNVDRLALTYEMEYDENGVLVAYDIYESVINSKQRMTYTVVDDVIRNEKSEYYQEFQSELRLLYDLTKKLYNNRLANGYIELEKKTRILEYDQEQGKIIAIKVVDRPLSDQMIEELMIATNKCGTMFANEHNIPIIRRVQDDMSREDMKNKLETLKKLGFKEFAFPQECSSSDMVKEVLNYYKDDENLETVIRVTSNKNRAYYTYELKNHSSLYEEFYAHLTSPIRRYPDLISSRQIKKYLKNIDLNEKIVPSAMATLNTTLENIRLCAIKTEGLKLAEYYQKMNEIMPAKVINLNDKFITIMLNDLTSSAILMKKMRNYSFDDINYCWIEDTKETIKIGDNIFVEVDDIDKYNGRTNFKFSKKLTK